MKILLLFLLSFAWGPSFLFIKLGIAGMPPTLLVTIRLTVGALFLYLIALLQRDSIKKYLPFWKHFLVTALFANTLPFLLISYGEKWISSALAGIINGTVPIFVILLSHFYLKDEKLSWRKILGLLIGFGGILTIFVPTLTHLTCRIEGIFFVLIASICYAFAMVYTKRHLQAAHSIAAPTIQLTFAALLSLPALLFDLPTSLPTQQSLLAAVILGFLGTAIAFTLYFKLIRVAGATYLSTATLLFPIIAILLGALFLKEVLSLTYYLGAVLILSGIALINGCSCNKSPESQK